jgi:LacI family transcriptional regulator
MSTIKDVAKYSGLSIATISKYLNGGNVLEENRVSIQKAIDQLGYKRNNMARGLKTNKTMTVGVLIPTLDNIFFTKIISHIEDIIQSKGYGMIVCDFKSDPGLERSKLEFLIDKHVDGIIMVSYGGETSYIKELIDKKIPVVLLDRMIKGIDCDCVLADNLNASYQAVEELIRRKHKRIGIVIGPEHAYTAEERRKGYIRVHQDYQLPIDEELIVTGDYTVETGYKAFEDLWQLKERPSAVFVTNYEMTIGVIMAINDYGVNIPEDLSLIGFDNIQMSKVVKPALSIVEQPMMEIGKTAAQVLLKRLAKDYTDFPEIHRLKTNILIKASVAHCCTENE